MVSIPNGMEFYPYSDLYEAYDRSRFNSQRDGILPLYKPKDLSDEYVSIPNGMEFYFYSVAYSLS